MKVTIEIEETVSGSWSVKVSAPEHRVWRSLGHSFEVACSHASALAKAHFAPPNGLEDSDTWTESMQRGCSATLASMRDAMPGGTLPPAFHLAEVIHYRLSRVEQGLERFREHVGQDLGELRSVLELHDEKIGEKDA